jgi:hypothetical protein
MAELGLAEVYWSGQRAYDTLKTAGFQPRPDVEPWPLQHPLDWSADPFSDNNWRFQLHAWRMTDPILARYESSGDPVYLREIFDVAADWWEFHLTGTADMSWNDMASGIRALRIAYLIGHHRTGRLDLSAGEVAVLDGLTQAHFAFLTDRSNLNPRSNHGIFQIFGLKRLSEAVPDEGLDAARLAEEFFRESLEHQFTAEGVHKEHSPDYHFFTIKVLDDLGAEQLFGSPELTAVLNRARALTMFMVGPDDRTVAVGDSAPSIRKVPAPDEPAVSDCARSGYAVVRSGPSMLFMTGARYSYSHKHADELSFVLYEGGRPVLIDSGKYGYQNDEWRRYFLDAAAHNTVTVAGEAISPRSKYVAVRIDPVRRDGDAYLLGGAIERTGLFRQERSIRFRPGAELLVEDRLTADRELPFVSSLHLAPDLVPELEGDRFRAAADDGVTLRAVVKGGALEAVRGSTDPILGWESTSYRKKHPTSVVRAHATGTDVVITWIVTLGSGAATAG